MESEKYTVIIPAAGLGKRMKIYGPKSLIRLNNKHTILSKQLSCINKRFPAKNYEVILVGGYQILKISNYLKEIKKRYNNIHLIENPQYEHTNVLYSIGLALKQNKNDKVLVVYGDLKFNIDALRGDFKESSVIISKNMKSDEVGCIINNSYLENIFYQLPEKWAQISFFTGKELELLHHIAIDEKFKNWFGFEAINHIMNCGGTFLAESPKNAKSIDIDSSFDLKKYANTD